MQLKVTESVLKMCELCGTILHRTPWNSLCLCERRIEDYRISCRRIPNKQFSAWKVPSPYFVCTVTLAE